MRITQIGSDYIELDEENLHDSRLLRISRVHLIKLDFLEPTEEKIKEVIELYPKTNRYIIDDNIRLYNYVLRGTSKKYYVENREGADLITFFRKNNKVLVNFNRLTENERNFLLEDCLEDILRNTEVISLARCDFDAFSDVLQKWSGNVIIYE